MLSIPVLLVDKITKKKLQRGHMNSNWVTVFIFSIVIFYYNRAAAVLNNANDNTNRGYPGLYNVV